jgi:hypothetical protein
MAPRNIVVLHQVVGVFFYHLGVNGIKPLIGTGAYKLGLNYAPGVLPQKEAAALGYVQNLWLHGPEHYLTEVFNILDLIVICI